MKEILTHAKGKDAIGELFVDIVFFAERSWLPKVNRRFRCGLCLAEFGFIRSLPSLCMRAEATTALIVASLQLIHTYAIQFSVATNHRVEIFYISFR